MSSGMINLMRFLAVVELLGGIGVLVGFLTRWASLGLSIIMLGAIYFVMKVMGLGFMPQTGPGWSFNLMILAGTVVLWAKGAGRLSLDKMWLKKKCGSGAGGCGSGAGSCGSDASG